MVGTIKSSTIYIVHPTRGHNLPYHYLFDENDAYAVADHLNERYELEDCFEVDEEEVYHTYSDWEEDYYKFLPAEDRG